MLINPLKRIFVNKQLNFYFKQKFSLAWAIYVVTKEIYFFIKIC